MFTRRDGLKLTLALAATAVAAARPGLLSPARAAAEPVFKVPPLGYGYDAVEPTLTMTIYHDRHHGAYVAALNGLIEKFPGLATTAPVADCQAWYHPETSSCPVPRDAFHIAAYAILVVAWISARVAMSVIGSSGDASNPSAR